MIIYGDFCTRYIVDDDDGEMEPYTGYTEHPPTRMLHHAKDNSKAPDNPSASFHHQYASLEDVTPIFRLLAVFPAGTDAAYGPLLESLFMVLLNSYQGYGYQYTTWRTNLRPLKSTARLIFRWFKLAHSRLRHFGEFLTAEHRP
jgi:hypothetical protein